MIELNNISKTYLTKSKIATQALKDVNLELPCNGMVMVLGKSGCGKSTLLNIIGGIDNYSGGVMIVDGNSTKDFSPRQWDDYRNNTVGFVFQEFNLLDDYNVRGNLMLASGLQGHKDGDERIAKALNIVGLDGYESRKISEISGGQKQRIAIARALVKDSKIILADEPTGNLDSDTAIEIMELLRTISKEKLVVVVTHDRENAERYADRIVEFADGVMTSDTIVDNEDILQDNSNDVHIDIVHKNVGRSQNTSKLNQLCFASLCKMSLNNLWKKKYRLIVTVILFAFSLSCFGLGVTAMRADGLEIEYNAYKDYELTEIKARGVNNNNGYHLSDEDYNELQSSLPNHTINKLYNSRGLQFNDNIKEEFQMLIPQLIPTTTAVIDEKISDQYGYKMIDGGVLPRAYNEYCISKYTADAIIANNVFDGVETYQDMIGKDYFKIDEVAGMKLVGIVDTYTKELNDRFYDHFMEVNGDIEKKALYNYSLSESLSESYSNSILVHSDFVKNIYFNTRDVSLFRKNLGHINVSQESYYDLCIDEDVKYIDGRGDAPLEDDEIIVPKKFLEAKLDGFLQSTGCVYEFILMTDNPYCTNEELIKLTAVGYYENSSQIEDPNAIMSDDSVYNVHKFNYISGISTAFIGDKAEDKQLLSVLGSEDFRVKTFISQDVSSIYSNLNNMTKIGLYASIIFGLFSIALMLNVIISSINDSKKQVGILRAMGMRNSSVMLIYLMEALVITVISALIAFVGMPLMAYGLVAWSGGYVLSINFLVVTIVEFAAVFGLSIAIGIIGSIAPIIEKSKTKPIDLIKEL